MKACSKREPDATRYKNIAYRLIHQNLYGRREEEERRAMLGMAQQNTVPG